MYACPYWFLGRLHVLTWLLFAISCDAFSLLQGFEKLIWIFNIDLGRNCFVQNGEYFLQCFSYNSGTHENSWANCFLILHKEHLLQGIEISQPDSIIGLIHFVVCKEFVALDYPPYSPGFAPEDIFLHLKRVLKGKRFSDSHIQKRVQTVLRAISKRTFTYISGTIHTDVVKSALQLRDITTK